MKTLLHLLPGYRSFSHPVRAARSASPSSLQTVHRRSPEGCGAPGLEKAPIDGGNSQEVFVVTHPVSLIQNSVSSIDRRRMNLTPQHGGPGEFGHDTVHLVVNLIFHSFPLCRKREPPKCRNLLNQFSTTACKAIKIMPLKQSSQIQQLVQLTVFIAEL